MSCLLKVIIIEQDSKHISLCALYQMNTKRLISSEAVGAFLVPLT